MLKTAVQQIADDDVEQALAAYCAAIAAEPSNSDAYSGAIKLHWRLNKPRLALELLEKADPSIFSRPVLRREFVKLLVFHNRRPDAIRAIDAWQALGIVSKKERLLALRMRGEVADYANLIERAKPLRNDANEKVRLLSARDSGLAKMALALDRQGTVGAAEQLENSEKWLDTDALHRRLAASIAEKSPLSFVRFGDGEGRFLIYRSDDWRNVLDADEHEATGASIWLNWFRQKPDAADPQIAEVASALASCLRDADVVGLPNSARLRVDNYHFAYLAHLNRHIERETRGRSTLFCDAFASINLHRKDPFYFDLLHGLPFIGIIGPHRRVGSKLAQVLGVASTRTYIVPPERVLVRLGSKGRKDHFPEVYKRLMDEIEVPFQGAVFLVAAGLLGKIYCNRIKARGGIAIDIGSVADAWMGFNSRIGQFDDLSKWKLP